MQSLFQLIIKQLRDNIAAVIVATFVAIGAAAWGWARAYVVIEIPVGAVVAFDLTDGCPTDGKWAPFDSANGRTIVGAIGSIPTSDQGDDGQPLLSHKFRDRSGGESTKLTPANLPSFEVPLFYSTSNDEGDKPAEMVRSISATAGNHPIQLKAGGTAERFSREMPNIALYYCKKLR